jgi:hypothetical protein
MTSRFGELEADQAAAESEARQTKTSVCAAVSGYVILNQVVEDLSNGSSRGSRAWPG